jgi:hypothetical protein
VARAEIGPDGATVEITFRDGAHLAMVGSRVQRVRLDIADLRPRRKLDQAPGSSARAAILEPFADELVYGLQSTQAETTALSGAGFTVDVALNHGVTVDLMEHLADYAFVYMETHSGILPGGEAAVVTGDTNEIKYVDLFNDGSLQQVTVQGQTTPVTYDAITTTFVKKHLGTFPDSSLIYLSGCKMLASPDFWQALHAHNAATLVSWDGTVLSSASAASAQFVMAHLATGESVDASVSAAKSAGLGQSDYGTETAHLGYFGDGAVTLARALAHATSTPMPTATGPSTPSVTNPPSPTAEPVVVQTPTDSATVLPTPGLTAVLSGSKRHSCKKGKRFVNGKCRCKKKHCALT